MNQKSLYNRIAHEWDSIASQRLAELKAGHDRSYQRLLKPSLVTALTNSDVTNILDVGCGVGVFTEEIGKIATRVLGVDISEKSIALAKENNKHKNVRYQRINVCDIRTTVRYPTVVSNMTLMTVPNLSDVLIQIRSMMKLRGKFIFTITHPCFWPTYWRYQHGTFDYNQETEIITTFRTRNRRYKHKTRHFHRPISIYLETLKASKFSVTKFIELKDPLEKLWYPRFILIEAIASRE